MILFLDFDNCLFDTTRYPGTFWEDLVRLMVSGGWTREQIEATADEFSDSAFDHNREYHHHYHLALLEERYPQGNLAVIQARVDEFMQRLDHYVFPDVIPFLEAVASKFEVVIVTHGDESFQRGRIRAAGIEKYAREVMVTHGEKLPCIRTWLEEHSAGQEARAWYIDDIAQYFLLEIHPKPVCVLMQRGTAALPNEATDHVVHDCTELLPLLQEK